jgi:hypothetical protein
LERRVWVWQRSTDRTHQSVPIATAKSKASNQDILSQDIEEAVVIKTKKNTTFKRNGEGRS